MIRSRSRATNNYVYFQNRLSTFTNPPIYTGNLYIEKMNLFMAI